MALCEVHWGKSLKKIIQTCTEELMFPDLNIDELVTKIKTSKMSERSKSKSSYLSRLHSEVISSEISSLIFLM